jgi:hypothetical protein
VPQDEHLQLRGRQPRESFAQRAHPLGAQLLIQPVVNPNLLDRDLATRPRVIERGVARDSQNPC